MEFVLILCFALLVDCVFTAVMITNVENLYKITYRYCTCNKITFISGRNASHALKKLKKEFYGRVDILNIEKMG